MKNLLAVNIIISLFAFEHNCFSQCQRYLSSSTPPFENVLKYYYDTIGDASPIYRGLIYTDQFGGKDHPFLEENRWVLGSLLYDDLYYPEIYLKYDVVNQILLTTHNFNNAFIIDDSKIKRFKLEKRLFTKLDLSADHSYYEVIVCGDVSVVALRLKRLKEIKEYPSTRREYPTDDKFFIVKNENLYRVKGKRSVLEVLEDQKKQLKKFISLNKIYFIQDLGNSLSSVVTYYNSL